MLSINVERERGGTNERIVGLRFNYFELPTKKRTLYLLP